MAVVESSSLAEGIKQALQAKGLTQRQFLERIPRDAGRWAVYRLLAGRSSDPRLSTFMLICMALEVSPTELIQLAGLLPRVERGSNFQNVRLREAFRRTQELDASVRELTVRQIEGVVEASYQWQSETKVSGTS